MNNMIFARQTQSEPKAAHQHAVKGLSAHLNKGEILKPTLLQHIMNESFGGSNAEGFWDWRHAYDCCESAAVLFIRKFWPALLRRANGDHTAMLELLDKLSGLMPSQTKRSEEQNALQQFSTPINLAYIAHIAAQIKPGSLTLEPSAGTGLLAVFAELAGANLHLNEIGRHRISLLDFVFPQAEITDHHAAYINGFCRNEPLVDTVIMNPPFSADPAKQNKRSSNETIKHFQSAFRRLKSGGRSVIITGHGTTPTRLMKGLDTAAHLFSAKIPGKVYARHGTVFDIAIHVIDNIPSQDLKQIHEIDDLKTLAALIDRDIPPRWRIIEDNKPQPASQSPIQQSFFNIPKPSVKTPVTTPPVPEDTTLTIANTPSDINYIANDAPLATSVNTGIFQPWKPGVIKIPSAQAHPTTLAEGIAMASLRPPMPSYRPRLDQKLIKDGILSDAQLETIIHAGEAHSQVLPQRFIFGEEQGKEMIFTTEDEDGFKLRQGFFLGDGTGAGKGRQAAGIILDNLNQGRTKALWFSKSTKLIEDARRDWMSVGGKASDIIGLNKYKQDQTITADSGILFITYATLRSGEKSDKPSRLSQILAWLDEDFDGVIIFDESHAMAGAAGGEASGRGAKTPSRQGIAGLALQNQLPNARVVYVSATGASSINSLAYATRLGLWSQPTIPFADRKAFVAQMEEGGVAAAEIVARDLKSFGLYTARNLSFEGVEVSVLDTPLTAEQHRIYDEWAGAFLIIHNNLDAALETTGIKSSEGGALNKNALANARSHFESAKQRFFGLLLTGLKCPLLFKAIDQDLENGNSVIIQIVSTGEAVMERCLARIHPSEWDDLSIDITPREYVLDYLNNAFPVQMQVEYADEEGKIRSRPLFDKDGHPVLDPQALAARDEMIANLVNLPPLPSALDQITWHYGFNAVAEITGRSRRIVKSDDGRMMVQSRSSLAGLSEAQQFMEDEKKILIFSEAGGTGRSYHADANVTNQRRRIHYLLETGWRADNAIQGLGRSNRTGQVSAPVFRPVSTDVKGEKRFISTIARRLDTLGAITRGQRASANQGFFKEEDNLESDYARAALRHFYSDLHEGSIESCSCDEFQTMTGLKLIDEGLLKAQLPPMSTFLNRLLALPIDTQNALFSELEDRIASRIEIAQQNGTYELGIETIIADSLTIKTREKIPSDTPLNLCVINTKRKINPTDIQQIKHLAQTVLDARMMVNKKSGNAALVTKTSSMFYDSGAVVPRVQLLRPDRKERIAVYELNASNWEDVPLDQFAAAWQKEYDNLPEYKDGHFNLVTGTLLPIWDKLPKDTPRVRRMTTDEGEVLLGRLLSDTEINTFRANMGLDIIQPEPENLFDSLITGGLGVNLANEMRLRHTRTYGTSRVEIMGETHENISALKQCGCIVEIHNYQTKMFVPNISAIKSILERYPVVY